MSESDRLTDRALMYIQALSEEIGPRPSGSSQERAAQEYIRDQLTGLGADAVVQEFSYPTVPGYFPYLALPGILFLAAYFLPGTWKAILIGAPFLIAGLPDIYQRLTDFLPHNSHSQNLILTPHETPPQAVNVWICAHIDSAEILPVAGPWIGWLLKNYMDRIEFIAWILALGGMTSLASPGWAVVIHPLLQSLLIMTGFGLIFLDVWQQSPGRHQVTRGANDNASGVALAAAIFEEYLENMPSGISVGLLISGAEEAGLYGASAFVASPLPSSKHAVLINLDMVGLGNRTGYVTRAGRLKPLLTDMDLNTMIMTFQPDALGVDYRYRGGDFIPFLRAGFRAISLEATEHGSVPVTYHHLSDTTENIRPAMLGKIGLLVQSLVSRSILNYRK